MATKDRVYTLKDIAESTGIAYNTLRQWKNRGRLPEPSYQIGQSPAWTGKTIEDWIATAKPGTMNNRKTPVAP
jgi:predicted DNA-binding transcriptional regulator AlpA